MPINSATIIRSNQTGLQSMNENNRTTKTPDNASSDLPDRATLPDDDLKATSGAFRDAFDGLSRTLRGSYLVVLEESRRIRWQRRKDRRIIECHRNSIEPGRGKFVFIITRTTFERIIQCIEESGDYFAQEVVRILMAMYYDGANFTETGPEVTRKTVTRQLRAAFRALDISIGDWKQPGIWTIKISHNLLKDAEEMGVDLKNWFLVV